MVAGGALVASLYANAVIVPQNDAALQSELDQQVESIVKGNAELQATAEGFRVVERQPVAKVETLAKEIEQLEAELQREETEEEAKSVVAAYSQKEVQRTAQSSGQDDETSTSNSSTGLGGGGGISGTRNGATIGTGAANAANVFVSQNAVQSTQASSNPGGALASQSAVGGGTSGGGDTAVTQTSTGSSSVGGTGTQASTQTSGGTVGQAASQNPSSTTTTPTSP